MGVCLDKPKLRIGLLALAFAPMAPQRILSNWEASPKTTILELKDLGCSAKKFWTHTGLNQLDWTWGKSSEVNHVSLAVRSKPDGPSLRHVTCAMHLSVRTPNPATSSDALISENKKAQRRVCFFSPSVAGFSHPSLDHRLIHPQVRLGNNCSCFEAVNADVTASPSPTATPKNPHAHPWQFL